jgi:hypothetical protein
MGDALGNIMATIMIHHIKNMRAAYESVQIAGCIMAACAMRIELPMLSWEDMLLLLTGISIVEDAPGIDIVVISNAVMPLPAPNRMYIQESAMTVARPVMMTIRSRAKTASRMEDSCIVVSGRRRGWKHHPPPSTSYEGSINGENDQWRTAVFNGLSRLD